MRELASHALLVLRLRDAERVDADLDDAFWSQVPGWKDRLQLMVDVRVDRSPALPRTRPLAPAGAAGVSPVPIWTLLDAALEDDHAAARSEHLAEWRDDVSTFVGRDPLEPLVVAGRKQPALASGRSYWAESAGYLPRTQRAVASAKRLP